jgi:phosphoribosylglycinamide formyltransferase 1
VLADDTPDSLAARVLRQEHHLYPRVLRWLASGRVRLRDDGTVGVLADASQAGALGDAALISPAD